MNDNNNDDKILKYLDSKSPLYLPSGSVRAVIALAVIIGFLLYLAYNHTMPVELKDITLLVLGYYFGSRQS